MPELIYFAAASLDGFIAGPAGELDWLAPFESGAEDFGYRDFYDSIDALLMGRTTFETTRSFGAWPYGGKPSRVFSHRPAELPDALVRVTAEAPEQVLAELEAGGARRIWLVGGGALAADLLERGLITELVLSVIPVLLGQGIPLFRGDARHNLRCLEVRPWPAGVVQLRYGT